MVKASAKIEKDSSGKKATAFPEEVTGEVMYTLKFNSPILPYAKFPLTQNKYI